MPRGPALALQIRSVTFSYFTDETFKPDQGELKVYNSFTIMKVSIHLRERLLRQSRYNFGTTKFNEGKTMNALIKHTELVESSSSIQTFTPFYTIDLETETDEETTLLPCGRVVSVFHPLARIPSTD